LTEIKFKEKYKDKHSIIDIISSCGHPTSVQYSNYIYKNTGILCKQCCFKKMSNDNVNIPTNSINIEYTAIKALQDYLKDKINIKILVEGTLADIAIQPVNIKYDLWLPIQLKIISTLSHGIYSFHIKNNYKDMYILLFCIDDQRFWLLDGNNVQVKNISIGKNNSIYSQYELLSHELERTLINNYNLNNYNKTINEINIPISKQSQNEQYFRRLRENLFNKLSFDYSEMNNTVYDVVINTVFKVQDKVITNYFKNKKCHPNEKRDTSSYIVCFARKRKYINLQYKLGDNDFYWLFLPDEKGAYIIPEQILFENNLISNKDEDNSGTVLSLYPYHENLENLKTAWLNKHLYLFIYSRWKT